VPARLGPQTRAGTPHAAATGPCLLFGRGFRRAHLDLVALSVLLAAPLILPLLLQHAPKCVVGRLIGIPCPGCGLGAALVALYRLAPAEALTCYPPIAVLLLGYPLLLCYIGMRLVGRPVTLPDGRLAAVFGVGATALVVGNWLIQLATGVC